MDPRTTETVAAEQPAALAADVVDEGDGFQVLDLGAGFAGVALPFQSELAADLTWLHYAAGMVRGMTARDLAELQREAVSSAEARGPGGEPAEGDERPYRVYDGVAHLSLAGPMAKRPSCMGRLFGGEASASVLRAAARRANRDPDVRSKLAVVDSPGGEVAGAFDLGDELAGGKPLDVFYEDMGASAALIATMGARRATANQNAVLGSVGIYAAVPDTSAAERAAGRVVHVVKAGAHKAIGLRGTEVTPEQLSQLQARVNALHSLFLQRVASGRPRMTKAQLAQVADAGVYIGREAVRAGLIDGVGSVDEAHRAAVKANAEGTRRVTVINDKQIAAYLSGDQAAIDAANAGAAAAEAPPEAQPRAAADDGRAPTTGGPPAARDEPAHPLAGELASLGVRSAADLRQLAADAAVGRRATQAARDRAIAMASAALGGEGQQAALEAAKRLLAAAPIDVAEDAVTTYEERLVAAGLAAPAGYATTPRRSAPPPPRHGAEPASASTRGQEDPAGDYAARTYGQHAGNGKGK